jgi:hypothetical protein
MKRWIISLLIVGAFVLGYGAWYTCSAARQRVEFYILTPSFNNARAEADGVPLCISNIQSVQKQEYPHWHMYIIDDASEDGTADCIERYISDHGLSDAITLIRNPVRKGAMENIYRTIHEHMTHDSAVVICLDGDDELLHPRVLTMLAEQYRDENLWLTYGNFIFHPSGNRGFCRPYPERVVKRRAYRSSPWLASHLRTFRVALFKKIRQEDCCYAGAFLAVNCDQAIMLPMLEMAGPDHYRCIQEPLYLYKETPLNDFKVFTDDYRAEVLRHIRALPPYQPLESLGQCLKK